MPKSKTYRSRGSADCVVLDAVEDQPCWGVVRFSSLGHYLCEGHRTPPDYVGEVTEEMAAQAAAKAAVEAQAERTSREATAARLNVALPDAFLSHDAWVSWVERQENQWFRPMLQGIEEVGAGLFWTDLSDVMLLFLHSCIGEGLRCGDGPPAVNERLAVLGLKATAEVHRRKLQWPEGAYSLQLAPEWDGVMSSPRDPQHPGPFGDKVLRLGFHHLSDNEVELLYGCAAVVADFSCLERGVRQCVMHVLDTTEAELGKRGLKASFLMDQP